MRRRGLSISALAIFLIVVLIIGIGIGYLIPRGAPTAVVTKTVTTGAGTTATITKTITAAGAGGLPSEIPIGVLNALSGSFGTFGTRGQAALEVAEKDINDYVKKLGLNVRFKFYYEDYATKPDVALQKVQSLAARGIKVIVGGLISGAVKQVSSYANTNKIVIIAGASTAPRESVAPPGGYVFRVLPPCGAEGEALVAVLKDKGIKNVAMITTEDTYSLSIRKAFASAAKAAGINIVLDTTFPPETKDFTAHLDALERAVTPYVQKSEPIAVFMNVWENHIPLLLDQANKRKSPLMNLLWIVPDTIPLSTIVLKESGKLAEKVKLIGPLFTAPASSAHRHVSEAVRAKLGQEPDVYALAGYDAAWIAALSILMSRSYDAEAIKNTIPLVSKLYWGATGNIELDQNGDRKVMDQELYAVVNGQWKVVAVYKSLEKSLTWVVPINVP